MSNSLSYKAFKPLFKQPKKKFEKNILKIQFKNLQLNNETPTYKRSKNILDLIICSKNILENIEKFDILSHSISDHCPKAATFKNKTTDPKYFENINWQKF
ncbi:hypothetical protein BpHYR1_032496 [Brachionus plicatilis]|uniref:RNA-directed DNA polymerase from mobile element jockey-like n=1 Tax=Brachionus plicatilis TaxID=10195 RepID=A0A3M7PJN0_BRAPC|nr:hypothetical protein BpHYR1_032496 [Brachionus plicatilis]